MAVAQKPRYVDLANPSLSVECPNCGLRTARFVDHCRNCGYKLWPSSEMASAAFKAWRDADPSRAAASRFDLDLPPPPIDDTVDFAERAHTLGIHLFPNSNYPFIICVGMFFLGLAAIPTLVTWTLEFAGIIPFSNASRFAAALPLGFAAAWLVVATLREP